jgi:hypothetical protein
LASNNHSDSEDGPGQTRQGFASENIRKSISEAAQKAAAAQAKELMETTIKPVTDQALTDTQ